MRQRIEKSTDKSVRSVGIGGIAPQKFQLAVQILQLNHRRQHPFRRFRRAVRKVHHLGCELLRTVFDQFSKGRIAFPAHGLILRLASGDCSIAKHDFARGARNPFENRRSVSANPTFQRSIHSRVVTLVLEHGVGHDYPRRRAWFQTTAWFNSRRAVPCFCPNATGGGPSEDFVRPSC